MKTIQVSDQAHAVLKEWAKGCDREIALCANEAIETWVFQKRHPIQFGPQVIRAHDWPGVVKP